MIGIRLGLADLWHDRTVFACFVLALAAVLAPLLVLYGLKFGIVTALIEALRSDPENLEVKVLGNHHLSPVQLAEIASLPEVSFFVPTTRSIAARLFVQPTGAGRVRRAADLIPTGPGDPLLPPDRPPLRDDEIILSNALARHIGVGAGDLVEGSNTREVAGLRETFRIPLRVVLVVPERVLVGDRAMTTPATLDRLEAFLDGFAVPELGIGGRPPEERTVVHANMRLYARELDSLEPLVNRLIGLGFDVRSRLREVEDIRSLDRRLNLVFGIVAVLGAGGYLMSLAASLWANVERKRPNLSVFRLLGASTVQLVAVPVVQALAIALVGTALSFALYEGTARLINQLFADSLPAEARVCLLHPIHFFGAAAATLIAALSSALAGGARAARIEPTEGIHNA